MRNNFYFRNVLFAPSVVESHYERSTFSGIRDAYSTYTKTYSDKSEDERLAMIQEIHNQISAATQAVRTANNILSQSLLPSHL